MFGVTILGNNSAIPAYDRHPTAQALHWNDQVFLIDCGEGTQMQLARYKVRRSKINHIFISHLHGDHYFGLIGLINSMSLLGRNANLHIYAPAELQPIMHLQFEAADTRLGFALHYHALEEGPELLVTEKYRVTAFPVKHRIPCWGFLFQEIKPPRLLLKEQVVAAVIPQSFYNRLKWGEDYIDKAGRRVENRSVTRAAPPGLSYAYCADTLYAPELADNLQQVSLLYHEATFLHELEERAVSRFHSTAMQAASFASLCQAGRLIIGHFSSKYETLEAFEEEARQQFANTDLAIEGVTYLLLNAQPPPKLS
jgi:ribonuclease Z